MNSLASNSIALKPLILIAVMFGTLGISLTSQALANSPRFAAESETETADAKNSLNLGPARVGIAGQLQLGHWTPVQVNRSEIKNADRFEIRCPDSNGEAIVYQGELKFDPDRKDIAEAYFRLGRNRGELSLRFLEQNKPVLEAKEKISDWCTPLAASRKLVVSVGSPAVAGLLQSSFADDDSAMVVRLDDVSELSGNSQSLESIDLLYINLESEDFANRFTADQLSAISDWVLDGGRLVISAGPALHDFLAANKGFARLLPGQIVDNVEISSGTRLNSFTNGSSQLINRNDPPVQLLGIEPQDALTLLNQDGAVLITRGVRGFGQTTLVTFDLENDRIKSWGDLPVFVRKLVRNQNLGEGEDGEESSSRVINFGYNDLLGQLRAPLDQFSKVSFVSFTWVAVLIGLFILCVGPLDFLFLKNIVGKMELTWITFSLLILGFGALAFFGNRMTKTSEIQINQLEIVDIDVANRTARSSVWANVYSPETQSVTLDVVPVKEPDSQVKATLSWHGLPGQGLGGMQTQTVAFSDSQTAYLSDDSTRGQGRLQDVPLQVSSSRPFFAQWRGGFDSQVRNRLRFDSRNRFDASIAGTVTNPLDIELNNCRVYFGDWVYVFDQPFAPGETVDLASETSEKNVKSYMTRRQAKENKGANTPWNPADRNLSRIANMMMFYKVAGGETYTTLRHDYHHFIDMSELLNLNRAILVGETSDRYSEIQVDGLESEYDQGLTIFRFVIPVNEQRNSTP